MVTSYKTGYLNFAFRKQIIKYYCLLTCLQLLIRMINYK
jgi:hypothetical protein